MGACAGNRKSAGEEIRLSAVIVGSVRRCAGHRAIAVAAWTEDRRRTTHESGIGYCGGSGIDSGARRLHQLAGAPREGAWIATRSRSIRERQRDREKAGGNERSTGVARSGKSAFPNCARDRSECISGTAAT